MPAPGRRSARFGLAATLLVAGLGCSSDTRRDQHYGTDLGVGWMPPDGSTYVAPDGGPDAGRDARGDGGEVGEAGPDGVETDLGASEAGPDGTADAADAAVVVDASLSGTD